MSKEIFEALCAAFDQLNVAIFVLSVNARVLFANRPANAMLEEGWPVRLMDGCLQGKDRAVSARVIETIDLLSSNEPAEEAVDHEICLARSSVERQGSIGCMRRLPPTAEGEPAIALFIVVNGQTSQYGIDGLAEAYGLSKAETRILKALVEMHSPAEAAVRLNVALSTVKSHLRKIFLKTNTSRQADLLRLVECCRTPFRKSDKG